MRLILAKSLFALTILISLCSVNSLQAACPLPLPPCYVPTQQPFPCPNYPEVASCPIQYNTIYNNVLSAHPCWTRCQITLYIQKTYGLLPPCLCTNSTPLQGPYNGTCPTPLPLPPCSSPPPAGSSQVIEP